MKKAMTINELANNLLAGDLSSDKDANVYVHIYDEKLEELRDVILNDAVETQTFFVTGQSGSGKTTALNFLKTETLEKHFFVKYIRMKDFLDEQDVDIIDFFLAFAFALVKGTVLEDEYYRELVEMQKKREGELEESVEKQTGRKTGAGGEADSEAGAGLFNIIKLKAHFFANYKVDTSYRKTTREVFKLKKPYLQKLVNQLIDRFREKVSAGKNLLVIVDDMDKLTDIRQINAIFLENRNYIFGLKCKKVIPIPTYLVTIPEIDNYARHNITQFVLKLTPNPIDTKVDKNKENKHIERNKKMLQEVIKCRIADGIDLIDAEALELAVKFSGGIIRQLIRIVHSAAAKVRRLKGTRITIEDIEDGIEAARNTITRTIISADKIKLLDTILTKYVPTSETSDEFRKLLHANNVLAYTNGTVWYEVNPLIKYTVEIYAALQNQ